LPGWVPRWREGLGVIGAGRLGFAGPQGGRVRPPVQRPGGVIQAHVGVLAVGQQRRGVARQFVGFLDRRAALYDRRDKAVPQGVEVQHLARFVHLGDASGPQIGVERPQDGVAVGQGE